ncbi:amino acid permease [Paenibacillus plantiphilus]|nr:amino acid permease [Paenibacillus plantiphilus]
MFMVYTGLLIFLFIGVIAVYLGAVAQGRSGQSLHQSLNQHSDYVRFMQDKHELNRYGYAQQLSRSFGSFTAFGASFSTLSAAGGALFLLGPAAAAGGPAVVGIGWPLLALFGIVTACSLAMLASAFPLAGGCYHWAVACGGRRLAVITGWLHLSGNMVLLVAANLLCASWLNDTAGNLFGYDTSSWSLCAIMVGLYLSQTIVSCNGAVSLRRIWGSMTWLHLGFIVGVAGTLIAISWPGVVPLDRLYDIGGTSAGSSTSLSFLSGLLLLQRLFIGGDAAAQLAEETVDPRINVPWSIYLSVVYIFIFGFVLFVILLMQFPSVTAGYGSYSALGGWLTDLWLGWGGAASWMVCIVVLLLGWNSGLAAMNTGARMLFSLARDNASPLPRRLSAVSEKTRVPIGSAVGIALAAGLVSSFLLFFSTFGESTFVPLILSGMIALHLAYAIPIGLKIHARRGLIPPALHGPWQVGKLSPFVDGVSFLWLMISAVVAIWILDGTTLSTAGAVFCCIAAYAEFIHQRGKKKGLLRTSETIKFSRLKLDEMIRIERKFPQQ